ncbi:uncharacterized protein MYCFIDRAFT_62803 [Pseudocercospora fijiensis CIRAD86]|uniref:Zn(2)-C6 fungal-type domain-containing protein n=1 Tax=Pseudocercospora fijiensis (strain CIRAD86) TaxID=383855 RepID=N1QC44_PSEFD|nr:uncharacterized protein MYCFIDRAFT_62803 [Pseudocercospora fijiensis CIRAD86]EME88868.1 hypothetical protein MYCFIDRAFT_62803 [Pseudocercospora fijiensis CIRAD86]
MSAGKRGRACQACSSIKIKCSLGHQAEGAVPPCDRCLRLGKDCTLTASKRQKDRVAELEAQVASLTRLLQAQGINEAHLNPSGQDVGNDDILLQSSSTPSSNPLASKKRRLEKSSPEQSETSVTDESSNASRIADPDILRLDASISSELQQRCYWRYCNDVLPVFPLVPLPAGQTLLELRDKRPVLFLAVMYAASPGCLTSVQQDHVAQLLLDRLANSVIGEKDSRLDLMRAIQIACLWYRTPEHHKYVSIYHLIQLCSSIAAGISLAGPLSTHDLSSNARIAREREEGNTADVHRAWIGAHVLSASMSIFMRRPYQSRWNEESENALMMLQYSDNEHGDAYLCQYFRVERLLEQIAEEMELGDVSSYYDISDPIMKTKAQICRNKLLNWKMLLPIHLRIPSLLYLEHVATALIHEAVLHTSTNKQSFAAPYIPENLSLADFPAPVVSEEHITAVYELVVALHAIIDTLVSFDTHTLLALPGLMFASRAAYALYLLAKLYIALTVPGGTLGAIIETRLLALTEYAEKLCKVGDRIRAVEKHSAPARILNSARRTLEWYLSYNSSLISDFGIHLPSSRASETASTHDVASTAQPPATDYQSLYQLSESDADFGLDFLFAEPLSLDQTFETSPRSFHK